MNIKKEFDYNPIGSYRKGNPYTIAFCYPYPLYAKSFIVKGGIKDVVKFLRSQKLPMIVHYSMWRHGITRGYVDVIGFDKKYSFYITKSWSSRKTKEKRNWELIATYSKNGRFKREILAEFKRVPRKWLKELNPFIMGEA